MIYCSIAYKLNRIYQSCCGGIKKLTARATVSKQIVNISNERLMILVTVQPTLITKLNRALRWQ